MMNRGWRIFRAFFAIAIGVTLLPLSLYSTDSHFGLGSVLILPVLGMSVWLLVTAREESRAWWFGLVICVGIFLPLCPWVERCLHSIAIYLQKLSHRGIPELSQSVIETTLGVMVFLGPLTIACLLGVTVGGFMQRIARRGADAHPTGLGHMRYWRFSIREMLIAIAAMCILAGWFASQRRNWQDAKEDSQIAFLNRFKESFVSGEVELLAEPRIVKQDRTSGRGLRFLSFRVPSVNEFQQPGVNEYRIVAPIKAKDKTAWAVWAYQCNERANDLIYRFAYAAASEPELLPRSLYPAMRYIEGTWNMVDGDPATAGPSATVVSVTSPARVDQPIVLTASAPPGTTCDLDLFPRDLLPTFSPQRPDQKGIIRWSWNVPSSLAGYHISYVVKCVQQRGAAEMASSCRGGILIEVSK
jgi:hypothetical protein